MWSFVFKLCIKKSLSSIFTALLLGEPFNSLLLHYFIHIVQDLHQYITKPYSVTRFWVIPPRRNFLWGLALADARAALKTLPCTCRLTFPRLWSMSLPPAPSLRVLLSLSHRTPQDGEVSTSLSEITSTAPLYLWGSRAALCSAGISRSKSRLNEYNSSPREEIYIGLLYTTTLHYSNRCGNT